MRFELLVPHVMIVSGVSRYLETGTIVDSSEVEGFCATPAMKACDFDGYQALRAVCDDIRRMQRAGGRRPDMNVAGFGHSAGWPGGEFEPAQERAKW
jgi:hypothetical protein